VRPGGAIETVPTQDRDSGVLTPVAFLQAPPGEAPSAPELLPLDAGEQYRFGFAMDACIGCHSCEVACAEQNDTPIDVAWRRVGELEGGTFPTTRRFNLSMACNHCLEPTCLSGCPTNAYTKLDNGVVRHDADECIGCQYCIWNCPYEVPVFDQQRKIVSKCDMCLPRLEAGQAPACVGACPTHAITVEKVDVAAWRADHAAADAPGLPPAGITLSTTRVSLPEGMPADTAAVNDHRVDPEDPHWPLVALTLLTQLSLGIVAATVATQLAGSAGRGTLAGGALGGAVAGGTALAASLLHLGRPTHALKALRNLRTSWLSREVALFSAFAGVAFLYAAVWRATVRGGVPVLGAAVGVVAVILGAAGVYASGRLYLVPARPVWNSRRTLVSFFATGICVGPLVTLFCLDRSTLEPAWIGVLLATAAAGTLVQLAVHVHLVRTVKARDDRQHRGTATLLRERFGGLVAARLVLAGIGLSLLVSATAVPLAGAAAAGRFGTGLVVLGIGEIMGRYLFYVTVVPFGTAGSFFERP
jgi:formate dehydrogenase iron-sulfur subunit